MNFTVSFYYTEPFQTEDLIGQRKYFRNFALALHNRPFFPPRRKRSIKKLMFPKHCRYFRGENGGQWSSCKRFVELLSRDAADASVFPTSESTRFSRFRSRSPAPSRSVVACTQLRRGNQRACTVGRYCIQWAKEERAGKKKTGRKGRRNVTEAERRNSRGASGRWIMWNKKKKIKKIPGGGGLGAGT